MPNLVRGYVSVKAGRCSSPHLLTHLSCTKWKWTAGTWRSPNWTGKSSWNKAPLQEVQNNLQLHTTAVLLVVFFLKLVLRTHSIFVSVSNFQKFRGHLRMLRSSRPWRRSVNQRSGSGAVLEVTVEGATRNLKANHLLDLENLVINGISTTSHLVQDFFLNHQQYTRYTLPETVAPEQGLF